MNTQTQPKALRILIAATDEDLRYELQQRLQEAGYRIIAAVADGAGAVKVACRVEPDLAVFDANLPQLNGVDAARILHAENLAPVVLLLADGSPALIRQAIGAGISSFISKPIYFPTLLTTIEMAAHGWQQLARRKENLKDLKENLATREAIDDAKSILMRQFNMKEQEAFNLLRTRSMNSRRKIRHVAEGIIKAHTMQKHADFGHAPGAQELPLISPYDLQRPLESTEQSARNVV